jgi:dienelactone hydrolase
MYKNKLFAARLTTVALSVLACVHPAMSCAQDMAPSASLRLTIEDLYSRPSVADASISPSGKWLAAVVSRADDDAVLAVDLATGQKKLIAGLNKNAFGAQIDTRITSVIWKTDDRLLFRLTSDPNEGVDYSRLSQGNLLKLGHRLIAVDRVGGKMTPLLGDQYNEALVGAFDMSNIQSMLLNDPQHILMGIGGWDGRSLFKVNVQTGVGKVIEPQKESTTGWWFDVNGNPLVRTEASVGTVRFYRKESDGRWKKTWSMRYRDMEEMPDFVALGPSADPDKYYVLARPTGRERVGLYLLDLKNESFGDPVVEHPQYDLTSARISRDGTRVVSHCYIVHVRICEFTDAKLNAAMRGLRKFFEENVNLYIHDASEDSNTILLLTEGPSEQPAFYYYRVDTKKVEFIGSMYGSMKGKQLPSATVINFKARDGSDLTGYLTLPPGAKDAKKLPLVLMPHGGPESRDHLEFHPWAQYFAARGYAVLQPNFRGSAGFGQAFAARGYGEWGRKMQDDLGDGVKALADQGLVDPDRVCIVGASYGGYAALAGATLTPTAYKCVVAIAGVADLEKFIDWRRSKWGKDSEGYTYWLTAIGDPEKDLERIRAVSPAYHIADIKAPILLIHGKEDEVVPYSQSKNFQKLLEKSGRKAELIELPKEGHSAWELNSSKVAISHVGYFLWEHLGAGFGVDKPPNRYAFEK